MSKVVYTQKDKWSGVSVGITVFCIALIAGMGCVFMLSDETRIGGYITLASLIALCMAALFYMPLSVSVDSEWLSVNFSFRRRLFSRAEIISAEPFKGINKMIRTCGSGGFFGYWGWFSSRATGKVFAYASNTDQLVLLTLTNGRKYLISCSDAQALANLLNKNA